jgi:hypothetical protein
VPQNGSQNQLKLKLISRGINWKEDLRKKFHLFPNYFRNKIQFVVLIQINFKKWSMLLKRGVVKAKTRILFGAVMDLKCSEHHTRNQRCPGEIRSPGVSWVMVWRSFPICMDCTSLSTMLNQGKSTLHSCN